MKKVITYGSFDLFHEGHYKLLERAKALGDYLIIGVTTEQYDEARGKLNIVDSLLDRVDNVRKTGLADQVIIEDHVGQKVEDILKYDVDIFTVGSDWLGMFDYLKRYCEVVYLERTKDISSTLLRSEIFHILKLGIVGTGRIARRFVPEAKYVSGLNIEAVFNPKAESARMFADEFQIGSHSDDYIAFLELVDAVYIASPHASHFQYAKAALENGRHVLCEKPMTLRRDEAEALYLLAETNHLVLMEGIKTAYCPGFSQLLGQARSGSIGAIRDVEAAFTKLENPKSRELASPGGGAFIELASYPLMAIFKLLGTNYKRLHFESIFNETGNDIYTKAFLYYHDAMATAKVGLDVKSEGQLLVSGQRGYLLAEAPWWKTQTFRLSFEDPELDEHFHIKFLGEGLRYEISDFVSAINKSTTGIHKMMASESIAIAGVIEAYIKWRSQANC